MAGTKTLAVTTAAYTDITVQVVCSKVTVLEDAGGATTKTKFRGDSSQTAIQLGNGVGIEWPVRPGHPYQPGEFLGQIEAADANATYAQIET